MIGHWIRPRPVSLTQWNYQTKDTTDSIFPAPKYLELEKGVFCTQTPLQFSHCTLYSVHYTVCTVHYTSYIVFCILNISEKLIFF